MKKILVVDDSQTILSALKNSFSELKEIEPLYAENYKVTSKLIREFHEDILVALLDVNLPDAPNGEVISLANAHNIPTVVLTGTLNSDLRKNIQSKSNIIGYILKDKPSSVSLAVKAVTNAIDNINKSILIIDDSNTFQKEISMMLKNTNLNILQETSPNKALKMLADKANVISLVITDYEMHEMNGIDFTIKVRELYNKDELGIIAMSSINQQSVISDFLTFGANDFILKPFNPQEVISKIYASLEMLSLIKRIKDMAHKDYMTGAYNRRYFFESGNQLFLKAKRKERPLAIAMIDIDKFKNINDTYGHDIGDIAIKEVKRVLDSLLRSSDLLARFGGEEFCILLEDISKENCLNLFEKILKAFEDNIINTPSGPIQYTVSIGIAFGLFDEIDTMVKRSDEALYISKESGRNRITLKEV